MRPDMDLPDLDARDWRSDHSAGPPERVEDAVHPESLSAASLTPKAFLVEVHSAALTRISPRSQPLNSHLRARLAQFWFGSDRSVHYEVWLHERTSRLEMGLHFEGHLTLNRQLYSYFDRSMIEIQHSLGSSIWLEEWDRGWARLYETQPLHPLNRLRAEAVSSRLSQIIACLQPMYETAVVTLSG